MKIKYRKVYRKIRLAEYFEDSEDDYIEIWVNPHREITRKWAESRLENQKVLATLSELASSEDPLKESTDEERTALARRLEDAGDYIYEFFSIVWKFDGKPVEIEEVKTFLDECSENDESLWAWLVMRSWEEINSFRDLRKKG
jgi:hypothetical protein